MATHNVLIADSFHPLLLQLLGRESIAYTYLPDISRAELINQLQSGATGLVVRSKTEIDREILQNAPGLKFIARGGAGMDNVDVELAESLNIRCFNAGEANSIAVGEHMVAMLLALFRNLTVADAEVRNGIWEREKNRGIELYGKTVGIIGYGNTGSAVAKCLSSFGVNILVYDKYKKGFQNDYVKESTMEEIFQKAEIVTFHVPLNSHTKNMVNSQYLHQFVRNIFLLNLSRGKIFVTQDILNGLDSGKILGFCADVLENEHIGGMGDADQKWFNNLVSKKNVILSPHIAGWTKESYEKISSILAQKIINEMQAE